MQTDYRGCRATIMGLGHFGGGLAAARWLARQRAIVTVTDLADEDALADVLPLLNVQGDIPIFDECRPAAAPAKIGTVPLLADAPIANIHLGGHRKEDFEKADLVVVNPAVRPDSPWPAIARQSGARLVTELELFIENCPARIIGVTGSNGKSTTAAMIAEILRCAQDDKPKTFLGGNIGVSLLERLPEIGRDDWVVLEISSFQLWHFSPSARMPHVAVVTGCSPNHLDWHGGYADYKSAKQRMLLGQTPGDFAVLNTFDAETSSWSGMVRGRQIVLPELDVFTHLSGSKGDSPIFVGHRIAAIPAKIGTIPLSVPGLHNRINAACAAAAALAVGCSWDDIRRGLGQFRGLPQRLEHVATIAGRRFYNDSAATTPESTIAALRSLDGPVWLLAGGKGKGANFEPLADEIVRRARGAAFFGATGEELRNKTAAKSPQFPCITMQTMQNALDWCWTRSGPGDAVLLSPGCASTDQFCNYEDRGRRFVEAVEQVEAASRRLGIL
jgi:UDP-N-acetylmuramoylalanine--D-glutamate ligase